MNNSKYGNVLTMILVVLIVAILAILGYFAYSFFYTKSVSNNADAALEEFKNSTATIKKDTSNVVDTTEQNKVEDNIIVEDNTNTNTVNNTVNTDELLDALNQPTNTVEQPAQDDTSVEDKVMMEDYEVMGMIKIPKTGLELPVLDKTTKRSLELSVTIAYGPGLNEPGNTIIFGHNYRNGLFFSNNEKIVNGDRIYITDKNNNTVTYVVYNIYETTQSDASYMQREVEEGVREISLQTCTDDSSGRIIIWAKEEL